VQRDAPRVATRKEIGEESAERRAAQELRAERDVQGQQKVEWQIRRDQVAGPFDVRPRREAAAEVRIPPRQLAILFEAEDV
jgi:hypothetical protein